jgi:hypothetical protein
VRDKTSSRTNSVAISAMRSAHPSAQRYSIAIAALDPAEFVQSLCESGGPWARFQRRYHASVALRTSSGSRRIVLDFAQPQAASGWRWRRVWSVRYMTNCCRRCVSRPLPKRDTSTHAPTPAPVRRRAAACLGTRRHIMHYQRKATYLFRL